jgi:hypothetical protein
LYISYTEKDTEEMVNTKFHGLQMDNHLNWKNNIEKIIPKLSGACCALRLMVYIGNINTLKSIYYAYFHSIIKYGMVFGDNSSNSGKIFTLQKKIFRIMADAQPRTSCRSPFKQLESVPVPCQYYIFINDLHCQ